MSRHYPAFLDLRRKPVLVVGGGAAARRKARALAACGARVKAVRESAFRPADLRGVRLVVSACADAALDARVSALCRRRGLWVNVADRPALCDFILPSILRRGRITVAVSTGGSSPALARALRLRLEGAVTDEDARLCEKLARLRPRLRAMAPERRRRMIEELMA